jgi:branched-chain amino acid transport system substrate-binding protein
VRGSALAALAGLLTGGLACRSSGAEDALTIGLLLSYTGPLAANSINSERALTMVIEAVNRAGGVGGRPLAVEAGDAGSDPRIVSAPAHALLDAGAVIVIGPDTIELGVELKSVMADRTVIMPSFATADFSIYKPFPWFVMGASATRIACELWAQLQADDRRQPLVIRDTNGYNVQLGFHLASNYGMASIDLPADGLPDETTIGAITTMAPDALVLAALPPTAAALVYTVAAVGGLPDPFGWYLAPTLHTPAFLDNIPRGSLDGARGVATGTVAGASRFRAQFAARWQDLPLDDAYAFYDAGAMATLAMQRAVAREGSIPLGAGLGPHILAVTRAGGVPVGWDELDRGLALLAQGEEVGYLGLSGLMEFDATGQTMTATTNWWTIGPQGFTDIESKSDCP